MLHRQVGGESHRIEATRVAREAEAGTKDDVKKGALGRRRRRHRRRHRGRRKGAAIGAAVGGTGTVRVTRGNESGAAGSTDKTACGAR